MARRSSTQAQAAAVKRRIQREVERAERAAGVGVYLATQNVALESMARTPVDQGAMRGSTYGTEPEKIAGKIVCEVGVGGPAESYAVRQHEDTALNHPEGGEDHFLQKALNAYAPSVEGDVAAFVRQAMAGGSVAMPKTSLPTSPESGRGKRATARQASRGRNLAKERGETIKRRRGRPRTRPPVGE